MYNTVSVYDTSRIVGNLRGRCFANWWKFFTDVNYSLVPPKDVTPPNFMKKTFMNSHKTSKFAKALPLERFCCMVLDIKSLEGEGRE